MTNDDIPSQTSPLYNVQPTSHTSEKRICPSLPYTSDNLKFISKFNFQFSDLTDTEYITLCSMLLKYKTCYATHKNDVGKISTPFRIRIKPNAQLMTQNRYRSTSRDRDRFSYDKSTTPPYYSRSRYDTYKRDSRSYRSPYSSSYRSPYRHNSRPRYRSRSYSRDNKFTKYTNSYRPPSRPRDSRFSRSRSHSNSRNKINVVQQQDQSDPIKFEVHMYHPLAMANAVTPTSWFHTLYVHTPSSIVQRDNPSRLEIAFLLDSGASISVLNYPTYITLTELLDIRSNHTSDVGPTQNSKTLTVANQTEVPILHYANIILNTTIDENSR